MLAAGVMTIYFSTSGTVYTQDYGNDACFSNTINELTAASYPVADVTISASVNCNDGDTASFSVTGTPFEFVTGYAWSYTPFSLQGGIGNNPQVNFGSPSSDSTTAGCKWFASPDQECTLDVCKYKISCTVTFNNGTNITKETNLFVQVPWQTGGEAGTPIIDGFPNLKLSPSTNLWVVENTGNWARHPPIPSIIIPASSQFYNKAVTHENRPVYQWESGNKSDLFLISDIYSRIAGLTAPTRDGLTFKIFDAVAVWVQAQNAEVARRKPQSEADAYAISDTIDPKYLYQGRCQ